MGIFSRIATFFGIRINAALDKAENPGQVMDYSYSKQLEQLQQLAPFDCGCRHQRKTPGAAPTTAHWEGQYTDELRHGRR